MTITLQGPLNITMKTKAGDFNTISILGTNPAPVGMQPTDVQMIYSPGANNVNPPFNASGLWAYGGTEMRNLAIHDSELFMGLGYWKDLPIPGADVPSGGSIMSLASNVSTFQIEQQFSTNFFAICALYEAQWPSPISNNILYSSTWTKIGWNILYYRDDVTKSWQFSQVLSVNPKGSGDGSGQQAQIRSMFLYTDSITSQPLLFIGETPNGIWSIPYDSTQLGGLGDPSLEFSTSGFTEPTGASDVRIMSFAVWNGKLYATIANTLYVRTDGASPSWTLLYTDTQYVSSKTGYRGLTVCPNNYGFFVGREGSNAGILMLTNASSSWVQSNQYMFNPNLATAWTNLYGNTVTPGYGIPSYNYMTPFTSPNGNSALFVGFESYVSNPIPPNVPVILNNNDGGHLYSLAPFLVYNWDGTNEWHLNQLPAVTWQSMESTRTQVLSPFGDGRIYIGGFDCNANQNHNTAWLISCATSSLLNNKIS